MGLLKLYRNNPKLNGDISYKSASDPTVYPKDSNHVEAIKGYFSQPSLASNKFTQNYNPNNTYLKHINPYI